MHDATCLPYLKGTNDCQEEDNDVEEQDRRPRQRETY